MALELLSRLRARPEDSAVWEEMYRALRPQVYATAYRLLSGQAAIAEDVTQDAFLNFLRYGKLATLKSDDHLLAYLRHTARHLCWDRRRADTRFVSLDSDQSEDVLKLSAEGHEDAEHLTWDLEQLGHSLPNEERDLLNEILNERSLEKIAKKCGITYSAAAVRVHRLREKLRRIINDL